MKDKIMNVLLNIYYWFFKVKPGKEVKIFIESLLFVFVSTGIAKILLLVINVLGGRILGPAFYGEYTLIVSISSFLTIPIGIGVIGGLLKILSETPGEELRKKIISTAFRYFLVTLVIFTSLYFIFSKQLAAVLRIGPNIFLLSVGLTFIIALSSITELVFRGLHRQKTWSYVNVISYVIAFVLFIILLISKNTSILIIYLPTLLLYALFAFTGFILLRNYFSLKKFSKPQFKKMFHYGFYVLLITIATKFLGNIDKIMLNFLIGAEAVGIYQAHFFSSVMIIGVISGVFINVFFPTAVKLKNPKNILAKLDKIVLFSIPVLIILVPLIQYILLYLYNFTFNFDRSLLFMIITIIDVMVVVYFALLSAQGTKSIRKMSLGLIITFLLNIPLNYILITQIGINGAIIATGISYLLLFVYIRFHLSKLVKNVRH